MEEIDNRLNEFTSDNELGNNTDNTSRMSENGNGIYNRQQIPKLNDSKGIKMNNMQENLRAARDESEDSDDDNLSSDDDDFLENGNPLIVCVKHVLNYLINFEASVIHLGVKKLFIWPAMKTGCFRFQRHKNVFYGLFKT